MTLTSLGPELTCAPLRERKALYSARFACRSAERTPRKRVYAASEKGEEHETSNVSSDFGGGNGSATVACRRQDHRQGSRKESRGRRQGDRQLHHRAARPGHQERSGRARRD